jgi:AraC family transcriptional regulator, regulatory protein of adaptative response / methylated-DNA-[protein]-cysteine methyltransferase
MSIDDRAFAGREDELYRALLERDPAYDGSIYYGIRSTGIFCRPVCGARKPKRQNVRFFDSAKAALDAGFRPCKLCRPLEAAEGGGELPAGMARLMDELAADPSFRPRAQDLRGRGLDPSTVRRFFKKRYGMTFQAFARSVRLSRAFDAIRCGASVTDAAFSSGYGSLSGFGDAAKAATGKSPSAAAAGAFWLSRLETPLGAMVAGAYGGRLCLLEFADRRALETEIKDLERRLGTKALPGRSALHDEAQRQLGEYFGGTRKAFELPLLYPGSDFERAVWEALMAIPYGETRSYGAQAVSLGRPEAVRAVAGANGRNRIALVIPCHRVIGADGSLTGYAGGLERKRFLLELEARALSGFT